jgi:hypothetical protein
MWWLNYLRDNRVQIVIVRAASLVQARMLASVSGLDADATFHEGRELDVPHAKRIPRECLGKVLSRREAEWVLKKLERA